MKNDPTALYDEYVDTFRDAEGKLPDMMNLKRIHTDLVVKNAEAIIIGEKFDDHTASLARLAALLHDTGRYEQLKTYNTFKDSDSVDHAVLSHDIVLKSGWLEKAGLTPDDQDRVLKAILYHNRRDLPEKLDPTLALVAKTVRDADKLDIFRVLEDRIKTTDWKTDSRAFWNLSTTARPNPEVIAAIKAGRPVDYQAIKSLSDFVLIQVGWIFSGLYFETSRRLARERRHLEFRREFLRSLTDDPALDDL